MGLGRKIGLGALVAIVTAHAPLLSCELKRAPKGSAEAGVHKPAKPVDGDRVRTERRGAVYYAPVLSRRIILQ